MKSLVFTEQNRYFDRSMGWDGTERRKRKRYAVKEGTVQYVPRGWLSLFKPFSARYVVLNVGESGLGFLTDRPLSEGDRLMLYIASPQLDRSAKLKGRVVWARKSESQEAWRVGVEFTPASDKDAVAIRHLLDATVMEKVDVSTSLLLKKIKRL